MWIANHAQIGIRSSFDIDPAFDTVGTASQVDLEAARIAEPVPRRDLAWRKPGNEADLK